MTHTEWVIPWLQYISISNLCLEIFEYHFVNHSKMLVILHYIRGKTLHCTSLALKKRCHCWVSNPWPYPEISITFCFFLCHIKSGAGIHAPDPVGPRTTKKFEKSDRTASGPNKTQKFRTNSHEAVRGPGGAWIPGLELRPFLDIWTDRYSLLDFKIIRTEIIQSTFQINNLL